MSSTPSRGTERAAKLEYGDTDARNDGSWANGGEMVTGHPYTARIRPLTHLVAGEEEFELCETCGLARPAHTDTA